MSDPIKLIVIATVNPNETESLNLYLNGLSKCYEKAGVKTDAHYPIVQHYLGEFKADFVSVMTFSTQEDFKAVYDSKDYLKLIPARDKAFSRLEVYISN